MAQVLLNRSERILYRRAKDPGEGSRRRIQAKDLRDWFPSTSEQRFLPSSSSEFTGRGLQFVKVLCVGLAYTLYITQCISYKAFTKLGQPARKRLLLSVRSSFLHPLFPKNEEDSSITNRFSLYAKRGWHTLMSSGKLRTFQTFHSWHLNARTRWPIGNARKKQ